MIRRLSGLVVEIQDQSLLVAPGGLPSLCLEVRVPDAHSPDCAPGQEITLHIHMHVREDDLSLFGFLSQEEYRLFMQLIRVGGVGPRAAVGLLGAVSPGALVHAILHNEPKVITQAPGIGPRTARKIIMELADRADELAALSVESVQPTDADAEMVAALVQMGFSAAEAGAALGQVPEDVEDEGERLRLALQQLG